MDVQTISVKAYPGALEVYPGAIEVHLRSHGTHPELYRLIMEP
jgi:hypothetical protein